MGLSSQLLQEQVQSGVMFFNTSDQPYLSANGAYSHHTTLTKACKDAVGVIAARLPSKNRILVTRHDPVDVVENLLRKKGLVMFAKIAQVKEDYEPEVTLPGDEPEPLRYQFQDVDGILNWSDVLNLIHSGKLTAQSKGRHVNRDGTPLSSYYSLEQLSAAFGRALKSKPGTNLATKKLKTLDPVACDPRAGAYRLYSMSRSPNLSKSQVENLQKTFGIQPCSKVYWFNSLKGGIKPQTMTAGNILDIEEVDVD